ncbi:MAG: membrane protein insertion efficiency factor YidD [Planctomycetaceae bacterium]|nr:membrane protein insertion efficiency factor YidD [Planctomycetaceae bacterium]
MMTEYPLSFPAMSASVLIRGYQRFISPYKGFLCAHRVLHQGESCSQYALRLVQQRGIWCCLMQMPERFRECQTACAILRSELPRDTYHDARIEKQRKLQSLPGDESNVSNTCWWLTFGPCVCDDAVGCLEVGACIDI